MPKGRYNVHCISYVFKHEYLPNWEIIIHHFKNGIAEVEHRGARNIDFPQDSLARYYRWVADCLDSLSTLA